MICKNNPQATWRKSVCGDLARWSGGLCLDLFEIKKPLAVLWQEFFVEFLGGHGPGVEEALAAVAA